MRRDPRHRPGARGRGAPARRARCELIPHVNEEAGHHASHSRTSRLATVRDRGVAGARASCDWTGTGPNDDKTVGLIVSDLDQSVFNTFASSGRAKPVSGLGDAAFAHVPTSPTMMIRQGKYEIDIGIVDAGMSDDRWLGATKALAALVLQRVR